MDIVESITKWRVHKKAKTEVLSDIRVGVVSSVTAEPLIPYLGSHLVQKGFKNPTIEIAPYNQIHQTCLNHINVFEKDVDAIVIVWRIEDIISQPFHQFEETLASLSDLEKAIRSLRESFSGTVIVSLPMFPSLPDVHLLDVGFASGVGKKFSHLVDIWRDYMSNLDGIVLMDLNVFSQYLGTQNVQDNRKNFLYKQPWTEGFWCLMGRQIERLIAAQTMSAKKCIVVDADDTLWGGVVGEDGVGGISLGGGFPGNAYKEFQQCLLGLQRKGVFLAVASKNNPDDFFEVLDAHDEMVLTRNDFVAFQIHWNSKVDSIKSIAKELNIGLDAMVFIDDSPKEIEEVQRRLPEVSCMLVPEEVTELPYALKEMDWFDSVNVTHEDLMRTKMIKIEKKRDQQQEEMSEESFKASLCLEMDVFEAQKQHFERVAQLTNKTNQFNLTTIRRTIDEVSTLQKSNEHIVLGMKLKDKYGEYGLVGVAILGGNGNACRIDSFLMSCRVLGRDAETVFLKECARVAFDSGAEYLEGAYVSSPKNKMVSDFYKNHGFIYDVSRDIWRASVSDVMLIKTPNYLSERA